MTKKEAIQIQEWLKDEGLIDCKLLKSKDPREMELRISKRNDQGQVEYLIIGLPLEHEKKTDLI